VKNSKIPQNWNKTVLVAPSHATKGLLGHNQKL